MDKYEYNLKLDQIKSLCAEENYEAAAEIADSINWNKIRNVNALVRAGEVYEKVERYDESRDILLMAYDRSPIGRMIIYRLAEIAIKMKDFDAASEYYNEFIEIAPHDSLKYVLLYEIERGKGAGYGVLIPILENLKEQEYTEEWSYELAYLYHKAGMVDKCIETCDELILWFGEGSYVERALELKMIYQPLTKAQEEKYRRFHLNRRGVTQIDSDELRKAGEFGRESMEIPQVTLNTERFNTVNLQAEIAKNLKQIMAATEKETVSDSMDNIKKMVEDIPYLQVMKEQEEENPEKETPYIETDEEIDGSLRMNFQELLGEDSDGQMSLVMDERAKIERQITGQMTIADVLEEWEKTRRAAETALEDAKQRKLESAKARAIQETEELMDRLNDVMPRLESGVTPKALLEEKYLQNISEEEIRQATGASVSMVGSAPDMGEDGIPAEYADEEENDVERLGEELKRVSEELDNGFLQAPGDWNTDLDGLEAADTEAEPEPMPIPEEVSAEPVPMPIPEEVSAEPVPMPIPEEMSAEPVPMPIPEEVSAEPVPIPIPEEVSAEPVPIPIPEDTGARTVQMLDGREDDSENPEIAKEPVAVLAEKQDFESVRQPVTSEELPRIKEIVPEELPVIQEVTPEELESGLELESKTVIRKLSMAEELENLLNQNTTRFKRLGDTNIRLGEEVAKALEKENDNRLSQAGKEKPKKEYHLTEGQKAIFSYFVPVKGMEDQLGQTIETVSRHLNLKESAGSGNIIIQGGQGCGKTVLATSLIKVLQQETGGLQGKVGKIDASVLNSKDIMELLKKVAGGCLIIEKAGEISRESAVTLSLLMEQDRSGLLVILEDTSKGIKKALSQDSSFAKKFAQTVSVPIFNNDELVSFAKAYSNELGYEIDNMAILALYNRISNIQTLDQETTLTEVKEIVDEAIEREGKAGLQKAFSILTAKRYTENDKILLREKDFE